MKCDVASMEYGVCCTVLDQTRTGHGSYSKTVKLYNGHDESRKNMKYLETRFVPVIGT